MSVGSISQSGNAQKARLIYVGDPLCSWCYGFSEEISQAKEALKEEANFELIMGGLRPYNKETMKELGDFLQEHWEQVSERSGKTFNYAILKDHSFVYDTEPPARAVLTVRQIAPEKEFLFFKDVQTLFYKENKNTNHVESYLDLLDKHDLSHTEFKETFGSDEMKNKTRSDFHRASSLGVRGFPSVLLEHKGQLKVICRGYTKSESIVKACLKIIEEEG